MASSNSSPNHLDWTGERMVPFASDPLTEMFHWQRYLYFRPWYEGKKVIDAASGEGYGSGYISAFATSVVGLDVDAEAIRHAGKRYRHARFLQTDVTLYDFSKADLILSFETIEHLEDPRAFLDALNRSPGAIAISTPNRKTHSPGNELNDKPVNPFHTIEWTPSEFAQLITEAFPKRQVRFLSQSATWPGTISEGLDDDAMYVIAVIDGGQLPQWPSIGFAIPTVNGADRSADAILAISKLYPGQTHFALVANGSTPEALEKLRAFAGQFPKIVTLIESELNQGYGVGANLGLAELQKQGFGLYGVANDDVYPAIDCLCDMVSCFGELKALGKNPAAIGPVSNAVHGLQQVNFGAYSNPAEMNELVWAHHRDRHSSATEIKQLRGLFLLIEPDVLNKVGGFDPRFGLGNFEDDDFNLRCIAEGYTNWMADGAYLHHIGSSTFREIGQQYELGIQRNMSLLLEKWGQSSLEALWQGKSKCPTGHFVALDSTLEVSGWALDLGVEKVDLIHQATPSEFAAYVLQRIAEKPREARRELLELLSA